MFVNVSVFKVSKMHDFHIVVFRTHSARKKITSKLISFLIKSLIGLVRNDFKTRRVRDFKLHL